MMRTESQSTILSVRSGPKREISFIIYMSMKEPSALRMQEHSLVQNSLSEDVQQQMVRMETLGVEVSLQPDMFLPVFVLRIPV